VIRADGGASCWGQGHLGDGSAEPTAAIVDVVGLYDVQSLTGGWGHTCALVVGGDVYCWGETSFEQLGGVGEGEIVLTPTRVPL
jgi:hypothetical protein